MSDQGKFINTYIDVMVGTIHENLSSILQLKTQLKLSTDLLSEKDKQIGDLINEKTDLLDNQLIDKSNQINELSLMLVKKDEQIKNLESMLASITQNTSNLDSIVNSKQAEIDSLSSQLNASRQETESYKGKATHADSLLQQIVVMKQEVKKRDDIIAQKNQELSQKDDLIFQKNIEIEDIKKKDSEDKTKKNKSKTADFLESAQINIVKTTKKSKDDF